MNKNSSFAVDALWMVILADHPHNKDGANGSILIKMNTYRNTLMLKFIFNSLLLVGAVCLAAFLVLGAWRHFGPQKLPVSELREEIADIVVQQVMRDLRKNRQDIKSVMVLPLKCDFSGHVTDRLRSVIADSGVLHLVDRPLNEKLRHTLRLELNGVKNLAEALNASRGGRAEAVLFGSVEIFESFENKGRLKMDIYLARLGTAEIVFERPYDSELSHDLLRASGFSPTTEAREKEPSESALSRHSRSQPSAGVEPSVAIHSPVGPASHSAYRLASADQSGFLRPLLGWLTATFLLPMVTFQFLRSTVNQRCNGANARVLMLLLVLDMLLAAFLIGLHSTAWVWFGLAAAALAYNFWVMSFALKLES